MMPEATLDNKHLSVVMTTQHIDDVNQTITDRVISSQFSPGGFRAYFMWVILVLGIVGTATNVLILYAMVVSKQHKKQILIFNQNLLDAYSCFCMIIIYAVHLSKIRLTGLGGYWLRLLIQTETIMFIGTSGSKVCLMAIAIERYLKIVHPAGSKKWLRNWMIYLAVAFSWSAGAVKNFAPKYVRVAYEDASGSCAEKLYCGKGGFDKGHGVWNFISFLIIPILIFIFCYGRILIVIRRQARVMAGHTGAGPSTTQTQSKKLQTNVVKTMIFVCLFFSISNIPLHMYFLLRTLIIGISPNVYYATMFIAIVYTATNPFIYGAKFKPVKTVLLSMIPFKKSYEEGSSSATAMYSVSATTKVVLKVNQK